MRKLLFIGLALFCIYINSFSWAEEPPTRAESEKAYMEMMGRFGEALEKLGGKKKEINIPEKEFLSDIAEVINAFVDYSKEARKRGLTNAQFYNELQRNDKRNKYVNALEKQKKQFTDKYFPVFWPSSSDKEAIGDDLYKKQYMNFLSISPGLTSTYADASGFINLVIPEFYGYGKDDQFINGIFEKLKNEYKADIDFLEGEHTKRLKKIQDSGLMMWANQLDKKLITPENLEELHIIDRTKLKSDQEAFVYIAYAIASSPVSQGDWYVTQGFRGAMRLSDVYEGEAFKGFFAPLLISDSFKLHASTFMTEALVSNLLSTEDEFAYKENSERSYVYQREHYIARMGSLIFNRFIYDDEGFYGNVTYDPCQKCYSHSVTMQPKLFENIINYGYKVYSENKSEFLNDKTLGDAIGIANALLKYDGIKYRDDLYMLPWTAEKYDLALKDAIENARKGKPFVDSLKESMDSYQMTTSDYLHWIRDIELLQFIRMIFDDINKYITVDKKED